MAAAAAASSSSVISERRRDSRSFVRRRCPNISHTRRPRCELCPCISSRKVWGVKTADLSISHILRADHAWRRVERSADLPGVCKIWSHEFVAILSTYFLLR